jgi:hypothetical protein
VTTYTISPDGIATMRRRVLQRLIILIVVCMLLAVGLLAWRTATPLPTLLLSAGLFTALVTPIVLRGNVRNVLAIARSIQIEVGDGYVARSQLRVPQLRLNREEVTALEELPSGLVLRTADPHRSLCVPAELDPADYAAVRAHVADWAPVSGADPARRRRSLIYLVVLAIAMLVAFFSTSLWLTLGSAAFVAAALIYEDRVLGRTAGVDPRYRRQLRLVGLILLAIIALKLCLLTGVYPRPVRPPQP